MHHAGIGPLQEDKYCVLKVTKHRSILKSVFIQKAGMQQIIRTGFTVLLCMLQCSCDEWSKPAAKPSDQPICGNGITDQHDENALRLIRSNCASCHTLLRAATGPPLKGILNDRQEGFLYTFLTNRKTLKRDSLIQGRIELYESRCPEFPQITQKEAGEVEDFLRW